MVKKESGWGKYLKRAGLVLVVVLIATLIDYIVHSSSPAYYVPAEYFQNKIIFALLWGFVALWLTKKVKTPVFKALIFAGLISIVLHTKYFLQGYTLSFVFLFMFLHFIMLLVPAVIIFNKFRKIFE